MLLPQAPIKEFVFEKAPFRQCHAATIAESHGAWVVAWFGGDAEGAPNVGIWLSIKSTSRWSKPAEVATGHGEPCWNPVLFQPRNGDLMLFYKVGPNPSHWWGMLTTSPDGGVHWTPPRKLPDGILGPIKNPPIQLKNGDILCPTSTEDHGWQVHFERTSDLGKTWTKTPPINDGKDIEAIQPSLLRLPGDALLAVGRTRQNRIFHVESKDQGRTWGEMGLGQLPNPNSGTDATTLRDGRQLIVYNPTIITEGRWGGPRSPLAVAISKDGEHWTQCLTLEDEPGQEFSYPTVIQTSDGRVHIVYTWKRTRIRHVVIDPERLSDGLRPGSSSQLLFGASAPQSFP